MLAGIVLVRCLVQPFRHIAAQLLKVALGNLEVSGCVVYVGFHCVPRLVPAWRTLFGIKDVLESVILLAFSCVLKELLLGLLVQCGAGADRP